jgi:hypothetical protein
MIGSSVHFLFLILIQFLNFFIIHLDKLYMIPMYLLSPINSVYWFSGIVLFGHTILSGPNHNSTCSLGAAQEGPKWWESQALLQAWLSHNIIQPSIKTLVKLKEMAYIYLKERFTIQSSFRNRWVLRLKVDDIVVLDLLLVLLLIQLISLYLGAYMTTFI